MPVQRCGGWGRGRTGDLPLFRRGCGGCRSPFRLARRFTDVRCWRRRTRPLASRLASACCFRPLAREGAAGCAGQHQDNQNDHEVRRCIDHRLTTANHAEQDSAYARCLRLPSVETLGDKIGWCEGRRERVLSRTLLCTHPVSQGWMVYGGSLVASGGRPCAVTRMEGVGCWECQHRADMRLAACCYDARRAAHLRLVDSSERSSSWSRLLGGLPGSPIRRRGIRPQIYE